MISQFLLYFDAFWLGLAILTGGAVGGLGLVLALAAMGAYIYGASGIASEEKLGYKVAVVASFLPLVRRLILIITSGPAVEFAFGSKFEFLLFGGNLSNVNVILNAIFEYALIALLLHQQSREHQKIWFS